MNAADLFGEAKALRRNGLGEEALALLGEALRGGRLGAEEVDRAGRFIRKEFLTGSYAGKPLRILLLGQCTTSWLVTSLTAVAWGHGIPVLISEGGYDNIIQELSLPAPQRAPQDVVILLPWNQRLLGDGPVEDHIEAEMGLWKQAWDLVTRRLGSRLLQVGYDWITPGPLGHHLGGATGGAVDLVREMNAALRKQLPPGSFFLDLEQVSGDIGRRTFYDPRRYFWTKQPFSERGILHLSEHLVAGVRALTTGPKKVLVVDLDNTLWGRVVGEVGPRGIALGEGADGEAHRHLQAHLKGLTRRGVLLAVASKNNPKDAREPFEDNPDMVLGLDQIAAFEACWEPKGVMIERIARTLNLGLDSFVFLDDNPAEREQVRQALPEVSVVEVPDDPAEFVRALEAGLWFEATGLTAEDHDRATQYAVERTRRELQESSSSLEEYLGSLEMRGDVREIDDNDLPRAVQLLAKTNQFNLTTRRHSQADVLELTGRPGAIPLVLRLRDRFGDHGLVSVLIGVPEEDGASDAIRIDTWLMSCRVIGRTTEHFFLGEFLDRAEALGYRKVIGEFIPTKKNTQVGDLYERLGFERLPDRGDGVVRHALAMAKSGRPVTYVRAVDHTILS